MILMKYGILQITNFYNLKASDGLNQRGFKMKKLSVRKTVVLAAFLCFASSAFAAENFTVDALRNFSSAECNLCQADFSLAGVTSPVESLLFSPRALKSPKQILNDQFGINLEEPATTNETSAGVSLVWKGIIPTGFQVYFQDEFQVLPHVVLKGSIKGTFFFFDHFQEFCLAAQGSGWAEWYPMSKQLKKLYIGFGGAFDYFAVFEGGWNYSNDSGYIWSFSPYIGYKFSLPFYFVIDVFVGYKYPFYSNCELSASQADKFLGKGFQWGFSISRTWSYSKAIKASIQAKKDAKKAASEAEE